jgi:hypothetical protein
MTLGYMACKRTLVATTDKQVFTSAESREQQARWLELADTALQNPKSREQKMNPGSRAGEEHQQLNREIQNVLTDVTLKPIFTAMRKRLH